MAKPIPATPTLRGKNAVRFVKRMVQEEKAPSKRRRATLKRALQTTFEVVKYGEVFAQHIGPFTVTVFRFRTPPSFQVLVAERGQVHLDRTFPLPTGKLR